jgi:hypothetical protein
MRHFTNTAVSLNLKPLTSESAIKPTGPAPKTAHVLVPAIMKSNSTQASFFSAVGTDL